MHRRQFVIGPRPWGEHLGWSTVHNVARGLYLSRCPELPVLAAKDRNGVNWTLIGFVIQTDSERSPPLDEIQASSTTAISQLSDSWAGRWVLIGNDEIQLDAAGLLGCYYTSKHGKGQSLRSLWVSSSPAVLSELIELEQGRPPQRIEATPDGPMNWYPPPLSGLRGVRRLLTNQIMNLQSGNISARRLPTGKPNPDTYSRTLDLLQARLLTGIRRATENAHRVLVPLSAGFDSRLVLALAKHADIPVTAFTMRKRTPGVWEREDRPTTSNWLHADMTLPPNIAQKTQVTHKWIPKGKFSASALAAFDAHSAGHTLENDRVYFSHGQWDWVQPEDLILRGGAFEVGHCFYWSRFPQRLPQGALPDISVILHGFRITPDSPKAQALSEWLEWCAQSAHEPIDWRDRMYLEQRLGGWLSSLEQALDLIPAERFYPVNSAEIFQLFLSLPESIRNEKKHQVDLIERLAPELLSIPFNPPDPFHVRMPRGIIARLRRAVLDSRCALSKAR